MAFYETALALGLKCLLIPIITQEYGGYYDDGPHHLMQGRFYGFNEGSSSDGAELYDDEGSGWGMEMPENKITWLNSTRKTKDQSKEEKIEQRRKELREVQLAYMTVSQQARRA